MGSAGRLVVVVVLVVAVMAASVATASVGSTRKLARRRKVQQGIPNLVKMRLRKKLPAPTRYYANTEPTNFVEPNPLKKMRRRKKKVKKVAVRKPPMVQNSPRENPTLPNAGAKNRTSLEKRFLSLFTLVSFPNEACASDTGSNGTCYSPADCSNLGGMSSGTCASGFGVCCLFRNTCGDSTSTNCTYFQNEGYPSAFDMIDSCQLTVDKANSDVCQLRLDFESLVLLAPPEATDHTCDNDLFIVSVYIDMGMSSNSPVVLTAVTGGTSFKRKFSIKISHIECTAINKASNGCLQYFTGINGQMQTFDFNRGNGRQISNHDYTICVRTERNFCGIRYTTCTDTSFAVSNPIGTEDTSVDGRCMEDWVNIPCSSKTRTATQQDENNNDVPCADRICGSAFASVTQTRSSSVDPVTAPMAVNSFLTPFTVRVHTDGAEGNSAGDAANAGFCLDFVQQPCY